ncbi:MAG: hypothetical protein ASARMPRED_000751 [Alectoria sarmentosa]|nr:MAG: hypothetical protein ASARMPRED_000751 [Alectoria sarmentosa]
MDGADRKMFNLNLDAISLYGASNSQTQYQLVQHIVALAFGGAPSSDTNISSDITGILNPGTFQDLSVDLAPWFNGIIDSTNLNNQAVGINWLDDGGLDPLHSYLNGSTSNVILTNTTNQYRLFAHFFEAFSNIFGCSDPPAQPPSSSGSSSSLSLAYVHKYMNLNYTDLGHFINQLSMATTNYGFSDQDSQTLNTDLNGLYNVRCAPPVTEHSAQGPQLLSLCQADTCPLAVPDADCAAYVNLTANGIVAGVSSSQDSTATATATPFIPTTISFTSAPASSTSTEPTSTATHSSTTSSKATLSPGAIAGIVIGGAAVLLAAVVALVFLLRRRRPVQQMSYPTTSMSLASPPGEQKFPSFTSQMPSPPLDQRFASFTSPTLIPTIAEMDSTHEGNGGGWR